MCFGVLSDTYKKIRSNKNRVVFKKEASPVREVADGIEIVTIDVSGAYEFCCKRNSRCASTD
jgi:hypothetical protein